MSSNLISIIRESFHKFEERILFNHLIDKEHPASSLAAYATFGIISAKALLSSLDAQAAEIYTLPNFNPAHSISVPIAAGGPPELGDRLFDVGAYSPDMLAHDPKIDGRGVPSGNVITVKKNGQRNLLDFFLPQLKVRYAGFGNGYKAVFVPTHIENIKMNGYVAKAGTKDGDVRGYFIIKCNGVEVGRTGEIYCYTNQFYDPCPGCDKEKKKGGSYNPNPKPKPKDPSDPKKKQDPKLLDPNPKVDTVKPTLKPVTPYVPPQPAVDSDTLKSAAMISLDSFVKLYSPGANISHNPSFGGKVWFGVHSTALNRGKLDVGAYAGLTLGLLQNHLSDMFIGEESGGDPFGVTYRNVITLDADSRFWDLEAGLFLKYLFRADKKSSGYMMGTLFLGGENMKGMYNLTTDLNTFGTHTQHTRNTGPQYPFKINNYYFGGSLGLGHQWGHFAAEILVNLKGSTIGTSSFETGDPQRPRSDITLPNNNEHNLLIEPGFRIYVIIPYKK